MLLPKLFFIAILIGLTFAQTIWNIEDPQMNTPELNSNSGARVKRTFLNFYNAFPAYFESLRDRGGIPFAVTTVLVRRFIPMASGTFVPEAVKKMTPIV